MTNGVHPYHSQPSFKPLSWLRAAYTLVYGGLAWRKKSLGMWPSRCRQRVGHGLRYQLFLCWRFGLRISGLRRPFVLSGNRELGHSGERRHSDRGDCRYILTTFSFFHIAPTFQSINHRQTSTTFTSYHRPLPPYTLNTTANMSNFSARVNPDLYSIAPPTFFLSLAPATSESYPKSRTTFVTPQSSSVVSPSIVKRAESVTSESAIASDDVAVESSAAIIEAVKKDRRTSSVASNGASARRFLKLGPIHGDEDHSAVWSEVVE